MSDNFTILVVDDNANNRFALRTLLAQSPANEVVEAASGEEALMLTVERDVHLVLLDVQMPGMDGFDTARHLQMTERTRNIPIIFLTAVFKAQEFVKRGFALGAVDYLTKPIEDNLLLSRVRFYQILQARENHLTATVEQLHQQELALIAALNRAEAASRAKSAFVSNMSHELRTPLNAIIGFAEMMAKSSTLGASDRTNLEIIKQSGEHLLALINDVLEISKIDAGRVELQEETIDIENLLQEVVALLRPRAERAGLVLVLEIEGLPASARVDATKLRQVLINLLGNAIKFTRQGSVTLSAAGQPADSGSVRIDFKVSDTGIGVAPEDQQRIFEPFTQVVTHATASGTGLGLAITRQYLGMMGGRLTVESVPAVGTTFRFTLLLTVVDACVRASTTAESMPLASTTEHGKRILIVDDDAGARRLLTQLLSPLGFALAEATDGLEAVERTESFAPDLIIMDWRMPKLDGLRAAQRINTLYGEKAPKILMVSASAPEDQQRAAIPPGVSDVLSKPLRERELHRALATHLGLHFRSTGAAADNTSLQAGTTERRADIADLAMDLRQSLREAVTELNPNKIHALIVSIESVQPDLARRILRMTDEFQFEELWALLQEQ